MALWRRVPTDSAWIKSEQGYDLAANHYDRWAWQSFWRENEFPILLPLLLAARPRHLLDIGVGTGAFLSYAASYLAPRVRLVGIDVSRRMLKQAQSKLGSRATLLQSNVQQGLPFRS